MRKTVGCVVAAALLICLGVGCGAAPEKGVNSGKDKPVPADADGKPRVPAK